ncbi:alkaline phosphatase [bacterium]|nr:alkaline phosphatase [bacterium]
MAGADKRLTRRSVFRLGAAGLGAGGLAAACATGATPYSGAVAFNHGVASGDPRQDRVILWTRVTPARPGPVPVIWTVTRDTTLKDIVRQGEFITDASRDYTVKVDVDGLKPGEAYYYWFSVGGVASPPGATRTLPESGAAPFRMAIVSCSNWPFGFFNGYREIARRNDVQAVIHLGDYLYEYGEDGYGGEVGKQLGRIHSPTTEIVTLADYRQRHAQYKSDPDLQDAHAVAPWFCTWDDHESTNNSYRSGAQNHQPATEGDWTERKRVAVQAYLEWMPVRDPDPDRPREAIYRSFRVGDLATLFLLESRLIGRSDEITFAEAVSAPPERADAALQGVMARVNAPERTMLGEVQEAWLAEGLKSSAAAGQRWQVLVNQVIMARVRAPAVPPGLPEEVRSRLPPYLTRLAEFAKQGAPWNLDAWDGFPAARERLYAAAKAANARLITVTGDTHTAWANELYSAEGHRLGAEFACSSITSPGLGASVPLKEINWLMPETNREVVYYNAFDKGYTVITLTADAVEAEYIKVSTVTSRDYFASTDAAYTVRPAEVGVTGLTRMMGTTPVTSG